MVVGGFCLEERLFLCMLPFVGIGLIFVLTFLGSTRLCFELICVFFMFFRTDRQKCFLGIAPFVSAMVSYPYEPRKCHTSIHSYCIFFRLFSSCHEPVKIII